MQRSDIGPILTPKGHPPPDPQGALGEITQITQKNMKARVMAPANCTSGYLPTCEVKPVSLILLELCSGQEISASYFKGR